MSKLYKLKEWFSLEDAAKRLSSGLGEAVSVDDVIQLIIEGHLPLSWFARQASADRVAKACVLHYLRGLQEAFEEDATPKRYIGGVTWRGDHAYRAYEGLKADHVLMPYAELDWTSLHGEQTVEYLDGVYRLELGQCGALRDWVHSLLTNTGGELITLVGYFVSDAGGSIWRILAHNPGGKYKAPDGTVKNMEPFYYPSGEFPDPAELVIQRADIETFEARLMQESQAAPDETGARERQTLHNIVASSTYFRKILGRAVIGWRYFLKQKIASPLSIVSEISRFFPAGRTVRRPTGTLIEKRPLTLLGETYLPLSLLPKS